MHPDLPSDPELRAITLAGARLAYADEGEGRALLLVHGLPGSHRDYRWLAPALSDRVRVIRPDLPGFGATEADAPRAPDARADLLADLLDALGIDRAAVLGHSMGGAVATALAARHPSRVAGLALLCSIGPRPHRSYRREVGLLAATMRVPLIRRSLLPRVKRSFVAAGFPRSTTDRDVLQTIAGVAVLSFRTHRRNLARVRCSTFVAYTADDPMVEPAVGRVLSAACPAGPRHELPGGRHNPQKSHATELGAWIADWMQGLPWAPPGPTNHE